MQKKEKYSISNLQTAKFSPGENQYLNESVNEHDEEEAYKGLYWKTEEKGRDKNKK